MDSTPYRFRSGSLRPAAPRLEMVQLNPMDRQGLERLSGLLAERIGAPCGQGADAGHVDPLRRQVHHAVTGIDAYLSAVEAGSRSATHLHAQARDLWEGLERLASARPERDDPVDGGVARIPAQSVPLP